MAALTPQDGQLAVLLERGPRDRWMLPWDAPRANERLDEAVLRAFKRSTSASASWMTQIGAFGDNRATAESDLSIAFAALVPLGDSTTTGDEFAWFALGALPPLSERHTQIVHAAADTIRDNLDLHPVAFKLLPPAFTLSELQSMYELLLGRRLHKASFRRALQAAWLVEPTDEWRSEGRGRPAQLYRYAPKRRRRGRRGVRFDLWAEILPARVTGAAPCDTDVTGPHLGVRQIPSQ